MVSRSSSLAAPAVRPVLRLTGEVELALGRVHEICGAARRVLAAMLAGAGSGPVVWIQPAWQAERLNGEALAGLADPGRFLFLYPRRPADLLWAMEECLRSGAAALVVADLPEPPALTPVRRLTLAAEAAAGAAGRSRPLGLILGAGDGGAQGVESRWAMEFDHAPGEGWLLSRRRARMLPPRGWRLERDGQGFRLTPATMATAA